MGERDEKGFKMVHRYGDHRWYWHVNLCVRDVPQREWGNASGWTRWRWLGQLRAWVNYRRLRSRVRWIAGGRSDG